MHEVVPRSVMSPRFHGQLRDRLDCFEDAMLSCKKWKPSAGTQWDRAFAGHQAGMLNIPL